MGRSPLSRLASLVVGELCFERRAVDPGLVARLRADASEVMTEAGRDGVVADPFWEAQRAELRSLLATGDPGELMRWPPVRRCMVKRGHRPVAVELRHLRRRRDWPRWRRAVRELTVGGPRPFPRLPTSSANALHLAYHLCRFEEATGMRPETAAFVLEFGGGYGGMGRLLHRLGFRGTHVIFDLPEVSALQRFYLGHAGVPVRRWTREDRALDPGVVTVSTLDDLPRVVEARPPGAALFLATWSLGEAPEPPRAALLPVLAGFDAFLLGYTAMFEGIDNRASFDRWRTSLPGRVWHELPIPHLGKPEFYLFGARPVAAGSAQAGG